MKVSLIFIGTEINLGLIVNTNATFISGKLAENGFECSPILTIRDDYQEIIDALNFSLDRSDAAIVCGGLGPTDDDLTRKAIADSQDLQLIKDDNLDKTSLRFIKKNISGSIKERLLKQSYIPYGATPIVPHIGSASGFILKTKKDGKFIFAIPGVPKEMREMLENSVLPRLNSLINSKVKKEILTKKVLLTTGISESEIEEEIKDLYELANDMNVKIGITADPGIIKIIIVSKSFSKEENEKKINLIKKKLLTKLSDFIYGEDDDLIAMSLKETIKKTKKNLTLSAAESMTGGLISSMITDVPDSSKFFLGSIISYSNFSKQKILNVSEKLLEEFGAVSPKVCKSMALNTKKIFHSDYAISVTGFAGPDANEEGKDVGLVYFCIANPKGDLKLFEGKFIGNRIDIKFRAAQFIINKLRLEIISDYNINLNFND